MFQVRGLKFSSVGQIYVIDSCAFKERSFEIKFVDDRELTMSVIIHLILIFDHF
jgi:hypothetical protein